MNRIIRNLSSQTKLFKCLKNQKKQLDTHIIDLNWSNMTYHEREKIINKIIRMTNKKKINAHYASYIFHKLLPSCKCLDIISIKEDLTAEHVKPLYDCLIHHGYKK